MSSIVNRLYKRLTFDKNREDQKLRNQRRALALPLLQENRQQNPVTQTQADLFARLPLEVRYLIYECVLEDEAGVVHVSKKARKPLEFTRCTDECLMKYNYKCCRYRSSLPPGGPKPFEPGFVSLLQTCQRVYTEAVDILYDFYLFDFRSFEACIFLSLTLPPPRWDAIRRMHLQWHFGHQLRDMGLQDTILTGHRPRYKPAWDEVWKILSHKKGLHTLILDVHAYLEDQTLRPAFEAKIFEPLKAVTVMSDFVVHVSWQPDVNSSDLKLPYQLHRLPDKEGSIR